MIVKNYPTRHLSHNIYLTHVVFTCYEKDAFVSQSFFFFLVEGVVSLSFGLKLHLTSMRFFFFFFVCRE